MYFRDDRGVVIVSVEEASMTDARTRALRAARVVTLGLVMATPGCYAAHGGAVADAGSRSIAEDAASIEDAGQDAALADAGSCDNRGEEWVECCERIGWDWERGCAAWGPFVPPADGEVA